MKKCKMCEETLPFSKFHARSDKGHKSVDDPVKYKGRCKSCESLFTKLRFFKITKLQYDELRESCKDCCTICGISEKDAWMGRTRHYGLYIDHDHKTGELRGLLCHNCNLVIGHAKDSVETLESAIKYLTS